MYKRKINAWSARDAVWSAKQRLEVTLYKNIDDKLARLENLESAAALKTVLKKFYKDLNDKSELCVVHFKVVQAPTSPTIELKKKKLWENKFLFLT